MFLKTLLDILRLVLPFIPQTRVEPKTRVDAGYILSRIGIKPELQNVHYVRFRRNQRSAAFDIRARVVILTNHRLGEEFEYNLEPDNVDALLTFIRKWLMN